MKSILILSFSDLNHDARVNRHIGFLKDAYRVTVASFGGGQFQEVNAVQLKRIRPSITEKFLGGLALLFRSYNAAYRIIYNQKTYSKCLSGQRHDLILSNDIETLPLAFDLAQGAKVLFDAHEYAPRHFEDKLVWRLLFGRFNRFLCNKYLPMADAMLTVGQGLAREYASHFPVRPIVLTNANDFKCLKPTPTDANKIRLVHHGAANPSRQLEIMIEAMNYLDDRFTLDMVLLTPAMANKKTRKYLDRIKGMATRNPRVKILPPVKSNEVVDLIHNYDVGVFLLPPVNFNYKNTLPNKIFDFVQARLAIAVGPTPEMAGLVNQFDLGIVAPEFTAKGFAAALSQLTQQKIDYFKGKSNSAAKELSAESNKVLLNKVVLELLAE